MTIELAPFGLLTICHVYDALEALLRQGFIHLADSVAEINAYFSDQPMIVQVAKALTVLEICFQIPANAKNITALLYPALGRGGVLREVRAAIQNLLKENRIVESPQPFEYLLVSQRQPEQHSNLKRSPATVFESKKILILHLIDAFEHLSEFTLFDYSYFNKPELRLAHPGGYVEKLRDGERGSIDLKWVNESEMVNETEAHLARSKTSDDAQKFFWLVPDAPEFHQLAFEMLLSQKNVLKKGIIPQQVIHKIVYEEQHVKALKAKLTEAITASVKIYGGHIISEDDLANMMTQKQNRY